ncbi:hypothetical protein ACIGJO_25615 [Streptomyces sp. NPDC079020]|uniref:hypothetical protein n=1 Tax=Streptomyces sp. NPDC079020 TaxID=3365722 RepID=UPI0037D30674
MNLDTYTPKTQSFLIDVHYSNGRLAGQSRVIACPFCGCEHIHGTSLGHRTPHCLPQTIQRGRLKGSDAYGNPGYELCAPTDDVNWDLERVYAQLWVARKRYLRLLAEHDHMDPWTAREKNVKKKLKEEIDGIAAVMGAAGVEL